ncbi:lysozyme inhibitor LprI family protein [Chitinasiproducens palmae]|uniref:lysozyme inhibitor LprI family protein n=1 Tax=Chitinasiproducens palmae TaxID=1770053 RepID=UPI001113CD38|nr:lysozyme inhibitor LprI family protein [Chitinasiproducens palmae]
MSNTTELDGAPAFRLASALVVFFSGAAITTEQADPVTNCGDTTTQSAMDQCAAAKQSAADQALNKQYKSLAASLDAGGKQRLRDAEKAWITFRDKECLSRLGPRSDGGSIWPMS